MGSLNKARLPPTVLQAVIDRLEDDVSVTKIWRDTKVAYSTIRRIRLSLEYWGQPYPPACVRRGRPPLLLQYHREKLKELLQGRPNTYLDEMQAFLYDDYNVKASQTTIWETLASMRWSRKAATKVAAERNAVLRRAFRARCQLAYKAEQVIVLDESACNERTGDRKYAWSEVNTPVQVSYSAQRSERWSLLPAMDVNGYFDHLIYQGAITAELMEEFVASKVLPYCTPYPGPRSVIVMDNASIHRSARIQQLCLDAGVVLEYLPPYSPDMNPIEQSFKALKSWMKKNFQRAPIFQDFSYFLELGVQEVCYNDVRARKYFSYSGWQV